MINRIAAIVRADVLIRFRRASTVVVFLLLSALAYVWIPDPSTGRALMQIGKARALYNSASIAVATAMLASLFVGLVGFYVVSNAVKRDVQTRCGFVLAATPVTRAEYVIGKFIGNTIFLATFTAGFMMTSMAMVIVRGEAPLEPLVFLKHYLIVMPPAIVFVSMIAITFESVRFLEGRFGDVAYFFVWSMVTGAVAIALMEAHVRAMAYFDVGGLAILIDRISSIVHSTSISIGASPFDASRPPVVFNGIPLDATLAIQRLVAMLVPLPLAGLATIAFHRFDPTRVRRGREKRHRHLLSRINAALAAPLRLLAPRNPIAADALLTITAQPLIVIAAIGFAIAALAENTPEVMLIAFAAAAIAIADVACRDQRAGTVTLIRSAPNVKTYFVAWKLASSLVVALLILAVPLVRSGAIVAGIVGVIFIAAAATSLAIISNNAKTFIVLFLSFWYIVLNDHGKTAALDFAGFYGHATPATVAAYLGVAAALLATAQTIYWMRVRRD